MKFLRVSDQKLQRKFMFAKKVTCNKKRHAVLDRFALFCDAISVKSGKSYRLDGGITQHLYHHLNSALSNFVSL